MDKQIEEIQKILECCCNEYDEKGRHIRNKCNSYDCEYYDERNGVCASYSLKEARALYNAGYRKIPEGAVVLTKEEYERHKGFSREEVDEISETAIKNSRKNTAEKFALKLADYFVEHCGGRLSISLTLQEWYKMIDEILKEITEEKEANNERSK
jgi:dephospho-CoA kinase